MEGTEDEWRVIDFHERLNLYNRHSATLAKGAKHCESCRFVDRKLRHLRAKMMNRFEKEKDEPILPSETDIMIAEVLRETEDEVIEEEEEEEVKEGYVLPTPPKKMQKKALREIGNVEGASAQQIIGYGEETGDSDSDKTDKEEEEGESSSGTDTERNGNDNDNKEEKEEEDDKDDNDNDKKE